MAHVHINKFVVGDIMLKFKKNGKIVGVLKDSSSEPEGDIFEFNDDKDPDPSVQPCADPDVQPCIPPHPIEEGSTRGEHDARH